MESAEKNKVMNGCDCDHPKLWINLLNHGSYEEIGRAVMQLLMRSDSECEYAEGLKHRHIEVTGS